MQDKNPRDESVTTITNLDKEQPANTTPAEDIEHCNEERIAEEGEDHIISEDKENADD